MERFKLLRVKKSEAIILTAKFKPFNTDILQQNGLNNDFQLSFL